MNRKLSGPQTRSGRYEVQKKNSMLDWRFYSSFCDDCILGCKAVLPRSN
jgi:hypothetical protein